MISDTYKYHGAALAFLIDSLNKPLMIENICDDKHGFFLICGQCPLYLKFSRSRRGYWNFSFSDEHQLLYSDLVEKYGDCIVGLICGADGVIGIKHEQMKQLIHFSLEKAENVSVKRKLRGTYSISGSKGKLKRQLNRNSLPTAIDDHIKSNT